MLVLEGVSIQSISQFLAYVAYADLQNNLGIRADPLFTTESASGGYVSIQTAPSSNGSQCLM